MGKRPTGADVAREAGVSQATVSYVLNDDPRQTISADTRARVRQAAQRLGYRPSVAAKNLRAGRSRIVLAVLRFDTVGALTAIGLATLERGLSARGLSLVCHFGLRRSDAVVHPAANLSPAVIAAFTDPADERAEAFLSEFAAPVVHVHHIEAAEEDLQALAAARFAGADAAARLAGGRVEMRVEVPLHRSGADAAAARLLSAEVDGVCAYNDEVAIALLGGLADHRAHVPEQIAFIGCDDLPLAALSVPALSTIGFDQETAIEATVAVLAATAAGEPPPPLPAPAMPRVIARASG